MQTLDDSDDFDFPFQVRNDLALFVGLRIACEEPHANVQELVDISGSSSVF